MNHSSDAASLPPNLHEDEDAVDGTKSVASEPPMPAHNPSLSDQIAGAAVQGTLDFLRIAGGLTLSTTGKLVAPPLHVTQTVVLPQLWAATRAYLLEHFPWIAVIEAAISNLWQVLVDTPQGREWQRQSIETLTCFALQPSLKPVLVEGMACVVKTAHGDQDVVLQYALWTRRVAEWLASLPYSLLADWIHDTARLVAHPRTTLALAKLTAQVCHALEAGTHLPRPLREKISARDRPFDPTVTIEQAILQSLGVRQEDEEVESPNEDWHREETATWDRLEEKLLSEPEIDDLEDLDSVPPETTPQPPPLKVPLHSDASWIRPDTMPQREGEATIDYFYRVLDQALLLHRETVAVGKMKDDTFVRSVLEQKGGLRSSSSDDPLLEFRRKLAELKRGMGPRMGELLARNAAMDAFVRKYKIWIVLGIVLLVLLVLAWIGLGFYGLYMLLLRPSHHSFSWLLPRFLSPHQHHHPNEMVIRVVREVVDGSVLSSSSSEDPLLSMEQLRACVSGAVQ